MSDPRERAAELLDAVAHELEQAAAHARLAAEHYRNGEIPRGPAHGFSIEGHLVNARAALDEVASLHAK